ncbi:MAG: flippase-like domain-containing protein [Proteobacteria bacterium]|nr:flippase-like domain-containing protein [Pseudomonadota bacterium]
MAKYLKLCAKIISYAILLMIISGLFFYYGKDILGIFKKFNWELIYLIIFLQILMITAAGFAFKMLCIPFGIQLRWQDWIGLSFIANFLNQILPYRPGLGFRYFYMKQHYGMKISDFIYAMLIYLLMTLAISCAFTLFGWACGHLPKSFNTITLLAGILIFLILGLMVFIKLKPRLGTNFIHKSLSAMHILINNPAVFYSTLLSLLFLSLITAFIFYFIFIAAFAPLSLIDCFFLVGIINIAMIFPITPGNIGVLETLVGTLTQMMYQNFSLGFSVTALYRATQWIPSILLGTGFSLKLAGSLIPKLKQMKFGLRFTVD